MSSYSTGLTVTGDNAPPALADRLRYASALAESGLLPSQYRNRPANVLVAIETGDMLGIAPMAAISNVHVIEGKPTFSAALMAALVRRAGHRIRVTGTDAKAVAEVVRADDPGFTFRAEWTLDRARKAGLTGKSVWKAYPAAMLKARAISEAVRDAAQDVFLGPVYTAEELGAVVDGDGDPVDAGPQAARIEARQVTPAVENSDSGQCTGVGAAPGTTCPPVNGDNTRYGWCTVCSAYIPLDGDVLGVHVPQSTPGMAPTDWTAAREQATEIADPAGRYEALRRLYSDAVQAGAPDVEVHAIVQAGEAAQHDLLDASAQEQADQDATDEAAAEAATGGEL